MSELKEKEAQAIKVLRTFEPEEGYVLAYSGGKDSDCIKILARLAGVKFEAVHNLTTADAPETMQYIKAQLYKCGHSRVGCIGCPMKGGKKMKEDLEQYPKYAQMYFRATDRMLKRRMEQGKELLLAWGDGKPETVMKWWLEN